MLKKTPFVILRSEAVPAKAGKDLSFIETVLLPKTARFRQILHCVQDDMLGGCALKNDVFA